MSNPHEGKDLRPTQNTESFVENQEMSKRKGSSFTKCSVGKHQGLQRFYD